jgi:hypothetical protein
MRALVILCLLVLVFSHNRLIKVQSNDHSLDHGSKIGKNIHYE